MATTARDDGGDYDYDGGKSNDSGYINDDVNYDDNDNEADEREYDETIRVNALWEDIWSETKVHGRGIGHWEDVAEDSVLPPVRQRPKPFEYKSHRFEKRNGRWWIIDLNLIGKEKEILTRSEVCPVLTKFYNEAGRQGGTGQIWMRISERYCGILEHEWRRLVAEMPITAIPLRYQKPKPVRRYGAGKPSRRLDPITRANPNPSWVAASGLDLSRPPTISVYGSRLRSSPSILVHGDDEEDTPMHDSQPQGSSAGPIDDNDPDIVMHNYQPPVSQDSYTHGNVDVITNQMILSYIPWLALSTDQLLHELGRFVVSGNQLDVNDAAILRQQKVTASMIAQKPPELVELVKGMELETDLLLQRLLHVVEVTKDIEYY